MWGNFAVELPSFEVITTYLRHKLQVLMYFRSGTDDKMGSDRMAGYGRVRIALPEINQYKELLLRGVHW